MGTKGLKINILFTSIIVATLNVCTAFSQKEDSLLLQLKSLEEKLSDYEHRFDIVEKQIDDLMWFRRLEDKAH
ncbi:MAG: S9 family peptidase, partial [Proteiniphilum sp.]